MIIPGEWSIFMVSQAPIRDGLTLRSPRGHLLFGVSIQLQGMPALECRENGGSRKHAKAYKEH
jgi:hypothetical protein